MADKSNADLARQIEALEKSMADVVGPIRDTLSRVKVGLVGSEIGDTPGLISRVHLLETQLSDLKDIVEDLEDWADKCDERIDTMEKSEANTHARLDTIKETVEAVKSSRSWWFKIIIGGIVSGAIGFIWYLVQNFIAK